MQAVIAVAGVLAGGVLAVLAHTSAGRRVEKALSERTVALQRNYDKLKAWYDAHTTATERKDIAYVTKDVVDSLAARVGVTEKDLAAVKSDLAEVKAAVTPQPAPATSAPAADASAKG